MAIDADYLPSDQTNPSDYTPEVSRRSRGVDAWASLRALGRTGLADLVERNCRLAHRFGEALSSAGFRVLNDVVLNQVLVSFGDPERTRAVIAAIQDEGTCWAGVTVWQGKTAMRLSVISWATSDADVDRSIAAIVPHCSWLNIQPGDPVMQRHIGILAHSADGAGLCYLEMVREGARQMGEHNHPEITLSILPMGPCLDAYNRNDLNAVNTCLRATAERLAAAGCDFFVCPDNTAHIALDAAREPYPLPGLHIAEIVAAQARAHGHKCVALLGTRWTMEGPAYPAAFRRHELELLVPSPEDRTEIDRIILDELCQGMITRSARDYYVSVIDSLRAHGCDAVALSCTEIPLLITPEVSPLPTLDSTRLLAREAVAVALGRKPLPTWRGGPIG